MKSIHLIRHAKSSWEDPSLEDILRPLNARGIKACQIMAGQLISAGCSFEHVFCSAAVRAQSTMCLIAQALPTSEVQWHVDESLYTFDYQRLLSWLSQLSNDLNSVTIIGHNPALTDLLNYLSNTHLSNLPTCAYAQINNPKLFNWQLLKPATFQLDHFITPKTVMSQA